MEKTESVAFDEIEHDVLNKRLCIRNEDGGTMEQKLKELLLQNPYTIDEVNGGGQKKSGLYQWDYLKSMFHGTDEELNSALRLVSAVEINGYWRIVDDICIGYVLQNLVVQAESDNSSFDGNEVVKSLEDSWGLSPALARHCLKLYALTTDGMVYRWDTKRVYVELARWLIKDWEDKMDINTFVYRLRDVGMPFNLEMLDGEILVEKDGDHTWVFLPSDHNRPNGNTLTSVSQAFTQNPNWFHMNFDVLEDDRTVELEDDRTVEQKLKALLLEHSFVLSDDTFGLYNWNDLKRMLDVTDEELKSALNLVSAIEIDGYWRIIDDLSIDLVLYDLVNEADSNDWSLSSLDGTEVVKSLEATHAIPPVVTRRCLELYASTIDGRVWELDTKRVCVELALGLLRNCGQRMEIQYFMDRWTSVRMPVSLDMLEGKVLVEIDGDKAFVHLPSDHNDNTLTSVSQAFPPDNQNLSRFYQPRKKKTKSRYILVVPEEVELFPLLAEPSFDYTSAIRDEDSETLEQKLKALLLQNPYTLYEEKEGGLYRWEDLKSMFHATDEELKSALRLVSAVEINGNWRIVDDMCIGQVLYNLVWKADSKDWSVSSLDGNEVEKSLGDTWGISPVLTRHCLELYGSTTDGKVWKLDTKQVCGELACWVIKSNGRRRMKIEEFNGQWSCVGLSLDMLEGEISGEEYGSQSWVYLPSDHSHISVSRDGP